MRNMRFHSICNVIIASIVVTSLSLSLLRVSSCEAVAGQVAGTQCWINGKLVGGFPPNYTCPGTGSSGSYGGGGGNYSNVGAAIGSALGAALGQLIVDAFSSNNEAYERRMQEEMERARLEEIRRQEEEARIRAEMEAKYQRIKSMIKGISQSSQVKLKTVQGSSGELKIKKGTAIFGSTGNPSDGSVAGQLKIKKADSYTPAPAFSAELLQGYSQATYLSELAANSTDMEEAKSLAEAAFNSAIGAPVDIEIPQSKNDNIDYVRVNDLSRLREQYAGNAAALQNTVNQMNETDNKIKIAAIVLEEAKTNAERSHSSGKNYEAAQYDKIITETTKAIERLKQDKAVLDAQNAAIREGLDSRERSIRDFISASPDVSDRNSASSGNPGKPLTSVDFYNKGYDDAINCYSSNAYGYCSAIGRTSDNTCTTQYMSGFAAGDKTQQSLLQSAYRKGELDGANGIVGKPNPSFDDPRAAGGCRVSYIIHYNSGYKVGRESARSH